MAWETTVFVSAHKWAMDEQRLPGWMDERRAWEGRMEGWMMPGPSPAAYPYKAHLTPQPPPITERRDPSSPFDHNTILQHPSSFFASSPSHLETYGGTSPKGLK